MTEWRFRTETGEDINPNGIVFPLTSHDTPEVPFRVIGTAFLIHKPGIFLTARHCLYKDNQKIDPWNDLMGLLHHAFHMKWYTYVEGTDVAIGQLDMDGIDCDECMNHMVMSLCTWTPVEKEIVIHWGCEQTEFEVSDLGNDEYKLVGQAKVSGYRGHFIENQERWRPFTEANVHVTSVETPFAASGGPVTLSTGQVCAITTSGSTGDYSIASLVRDALNARVPPHFRLEGETKGRKQSFGELLEEFGLKVLKGD